MAISTKDDKDQDARRLHESVPLSSAEQSEFDQLAASLHDTPAGDSDRPYTPVPDTTQYDDELPVAAGQKQDFTPDELQKKEQQSREDEPTLGKGYTSGGDTQKEQEPTEGGRFGRARRRISNFVNKRKRPLIIGGGLSAAGVIGGILTLSFLPFQLNHILENIDLKTFARLQGVHAEGRSSKWVQAYMMARLLDIETPESGVNNKTTDNVLFRANRVDYNQPWIDWYRTMRTSNFEQEMFEKYGIKFSSSFYHDGNKIVIRVAKITVRDTPLTFDPFSGPDAISPDLIDRLTAGDVSAFEELDRLNGRLDEFIQVEFFDNRGGRKEVKKVMRDMLQINGWNWWNGFKRFHIRKDIQNMTGITGWIFFETKRQEWREKRVDIRNKVLGKALPANVKSGKFLRCMFGIDNCRASTDPSSPDNRNLPVVGQREGDPIGDGAGEDRLQPGVQAPDPGGGDAQLSDTSIKIAQELVKKAGLAVGVVSVLDALSRFDESVYNHSLSAMVTVARGQQLAGLYTTYSLAKDQLRTGEVVGEEVDDLMKTVSTTTNNEGWSTLIDERPNIVHAAEFVPAATKKEYCSAQHQEKIRKPENRAAADNEFVYNCDQDKIGAATNILAFENSYTDSVGQLLHPILMVFRNTAGVVLDVFNQIADALLQPLIGGIISAIGLKGGIDYVVGWMSAKVLQFSGAGIMWDYLTLPGRMINLIIQGGAYVAEGAARGQGAAKTTPETEVLAQQRYYAYQQQKRADSSLHERYLALENPESVASNVLFALVNRSPNSIGPGLLGSMGSAFTAPFSLASKTVNAQSVDSPYIAARKLAAIETFDFPKECLDANPLYMTPWSATNADEMGIFDQNELTWDLMRNKDSWYAALYEKVDNDEEEAKKVWNCALLDNAVAGAMGGVYGYKGVGAISSEQ